MQEALRKAAVALVGRAGAAWLRSWMRGVRVVVCARRAIVPRFASRPYIYCIWHENLLVPIHIFRNSGLSTLISSHRDGDYAAALAQQFGFVVVRGSATRGGFPALRQLVELVRRRHVAITADGPKGPRRRLKEGVAYLARTTGTPVIATGFGYTAAWRANSWDRFAIPKYGSTVFVYPSEPIVFRRDTPIEECACQLQDAMDAVQAKAEELARKAGAQPLQMPLGRDRQAA